MSESSYTAHCNDMKYQMELICYVCLYVKYLVDESTLLFIVIMMNFITIKLIDDLCDIYNEVVNNLQLKLLKYFQKVMLVQLLLTGLVYYFDLRDHLVLHLIVEEPHPKWHNIVMLGTLNLVIPMIQLIQLSISLNRDLKQLLQYHKYGILILFTDMSQYHISRNTAENNSTSSQPSINLNSYSDYTIGGISTASGYGSIS